MLGTEKCVVEGYVVEGDGRPSGGWNNEFCVVQIGIYGR